MLDKFKELLKAKVKASGVNLSAKRIDAYADRLHKKFPELKDEDDHDQPIEDLDQLVSFADVAKEDDRVRALEALTKPKPEPKPADPKPEPSNDEPEWFKRYREETNAKLTAFEKEKTQGTIRQKLADKLKEIPKDFYSEWALPETEEHLDSFTEKVTSKYDAFKQDLVNKGLAIQTKPAGGNGGGGGSKPTDAELDKIMDKIKI